MWLSRARGVGAHGMTPCVVMACSVVAACMGSMQHVFITVHYDGKVVLHGCWWFLHGWCMAGGQLVQACVRNAKA